jgi:type VI secretion system protein ImpM
VTASTADLRLGFYGKMPAHGDFVARRLLPSFVEPWDAWLQEAIAKSREQFAEDWLSTYLTAPIWRFLVDRGVCGELATIGVVMPSVDRVGRYFPLTLAIPLDPRPAPVRTMLEAASWLARVEEVALSALDDDCDVEALDRIAAAVAGPAPASVEDAVYQTGGASALSGAAAGCPATGGLDIADACLGHLTGPCTLWWTAGSDEFRPIFMVAAGLPAVQNFAALLDGGWERWGWTRR